MTRQGKDGKETQNQKFESAFKEEGNKGAQLPRYASTNYIWRIFANLFYTKFTYDDTKALCCNVDEKETKDETPLYQSLKDAPKSSPKVENPSCPSRKDAPHLSPGVENACMDNIYIL